MDVDKPSGVVHRAMFDQVKEELDRTKELLASTVAQCEHFQYELKAAQIALSVAIMDRGHALAEVQRQEEVIKGTSVMALFELLDTVKPAQIGPGKVTFKLSDWQRIVTAIHAIRP